MLRSLPFAARNLVRQPGRTAVGVLGIAAVGALLFDMLLLSRGLVVSFRDLLDRAGFDVRVMAGEIAPIGGPKIQKAGDAVRAGAALPEVDQAVALRMAEAETAQGERPTRFTLMGIDTRSRRLWTIAEGADLDGDGPAMVVNRRLQQALALAPGAVVKLRANCSSDRAAASPVDFRVAG